MFLGVVEAHFRLETPALAGTAVASKSASIRVPALLGAMRRVFWLLAPVDPAFRNAGAFAEAKARRRIEQLLGRAGDEGPESRSGTQEIGQGSFLFSLGDGDVPGEPTAFSSALAALAGGILGQRREHHNASLVQAVTPVSFALRLHHRKDRSEFREPMIALLRAYGLLGGVGAATRRGFGSLTLTALRGAEVSMETSASAGDYRMKLRALFSPDTVPAPPPSGALPYSGFWGVSGLPAALYVRDFGLPVNEAHEVLSKEIARFASSVSSTWRPITGKRPTTCSADTVFSYQSEAVSKVADNAVKRTPSPLLFHFRGHEDGTSSVVATVAPVGHVASDAILIGRIQDYIGAPAHRFTKLWPGESL